MHAGKASVVGQTAFFYHFFLPFIHQQANEWLAAPVGTTRLWRLKQTSIELNLLGCLRRHPTLEMTSHSLTTPI